MAPHLIVGLRHGEKPADAEDESTPLDDAGPGLDETGQVERRSLTLRGWQRSGALAGTLLCAQLSADALSGPVTLFVPQYAHTRRHRSYETVHALALRLNAPLHHPCAADAVDDLYTQVLTCEGVVVVCWEHGALVTLAGRLSNSAPAGWPHGRFDALWVFHKNVGDSGDLYGWQQVSQRLLPGDAD